MLRIIYEFIQEARSPKLASAFVIAAVILSIDIIWLLNSKFYLSQHSLQWSVAAALTATALLPIIKNQSVRTLVCGYLLLVVAWRALRLFNHLTFTVSGEYVDAMLADWDVALGFQWLPYATWLDDHPRFTSIISMAYGSLTPLSIGVFIVVAFICPRNVAEEYLLLFVALAVIVSVVGIFLPTYGPMIYFADATKQFHYLGEAGQSHVPFYEAYRAKTLHALPLENLIGLTTFPSFHTAMGCLMIYVSRQRMILLIPSVIYSSMMIAGAVVFGSHYFVDLIGGLAITAISVFAVRSMPKLLANRNAQTVGWKGSVTDKL